MAGTSSGQPKPDKQLKGRHLNWAGQPIKDDRDYGGRTETSVQSRTFGFEPENPPQPLVPPKNVGTTTIIYDAEAENAKKEALRSHPLFKEWDENFSDRCTFEAFCKERGSEGRGKLSGGESMTAPPAQSPAEALQKEIKAKKPSGFTRMWAELKASPEKMAEWRRKQAEGRKKKQ